MPVLRTDERCGHDLLRLFDDRVQVLFALEALGVNFVVVFGAGGARGEPAVFCHNLQHADTTAASAISRPRRSTTRSIIPLLTTVLPTRNSPGQCGRRVSRNSIATAR